MFGGDTVITRFSLKRKFPVFYNSAFGIGDMIPFPYMDYRNVGYPRYLLIMIQGKMRLKPRITNVSIVGHLLIKEDMLFTQIGRACMN